MINNISWQGYWVAIALLTGTYYLVIFLFYYRKDLISWFGGRQVEHVSSTAPIEMNEKNVEQAQLSTEDLFLRHVGDERPEVLLIVQALKDEVQAFITEAGNNGFDKEQIMSALQLLLSKHPSIKASTYKQIIQNFIVRECETNCSVLLSEDDVDGLWAE